MDILNNIKLHQVILVIIVILIGVNIWKIIKHYRYLRKSQNRNTSHLDYISRLMEMLSKLSVAFTKVRSKVMEFDQTLRPSDDELARCCPDIEEMMANVLIERKSILTRIDTLVTQWEMDQAPDDLNEVISELEDDISKLINKLESFDDLIDSKLNKK